MLRLGVLFALVLVAGGPTAVPTSVTTARPVAAIVRNEIPPHSAERPLAAPSCLAVVEGVCLAPPPAAGDPPRRPSSEYALFQRPPPRLD